MLAALVATDSPDPWFLSMIFREPPGFSRPSLILSPGLGLGVLMFDPDTGCVFCFGPVVSAFGGAVITGAIIDVEGVLDNAPPVLLNEELLGLPVVVVTIGVVTVAFGVVVDGPDDVAPPPVLLDEKNPVLPEPPEPP